MTDFTVFVEGIGIGKMNVYMLMLKTVQFDDYAISLCVECMRTSTVCEATSLF